MTSLQHGIGEAADEAWLQGQVFKTPPQKRVYSKAEFDEGGSAIIESLKVGMLVNAKDVLGVVHHLNSGVTVCGQITLRAPLSFAKIVAFCFPV